MGVGLAGLSDSMQVGSITFGEKACSANNPVTIKDYVEAINRKYPEESKEVLKHLHYFKDVSNLDIIDVYRVLDLFEVTNPCLQHAIKKLLVAGGRGYKDITKDVQEAIDTLERWKAMKEEDNE